MFSPITRSTLACVQGGLGRGGVSPYLSIEAVPVEQLIFGDGSGFLLLETGDFLLWNAVTGNTFNQLLLIGA